MIVIDCIQGTDEWWEARTGVPTASEFNQVLTPPDYREKWDCGNAECTHVAEKAAKNCKKGGGSAKKYKDVSMRKSASSQPYMNKLLAEWVRGVPDESFQSEWMKRGHDLEGEAASYYELETGKTCEKVGFCLDGAGYGCSPDRLIGSDGGLEVKCPSAGVHIGYLINGILPPIYRLQVLGCLLITGREWWDFESYHPDMKPLVIRTEAAKVKEEIQVLQSALAEFMGRLNKQKGILIQRGLKEAA